MKRAAASSRGASRLASMLVAVVVAWLPIVAAAQGDGDAPPAPVLAQPKLRQFAQAEYPKAALDAGIEAAVVLRLDIDAQGTVTAAEVAVPAGRGFDEAAQAAALRFVFEPATKDGTPIAARILYRYEFTLSEAPPPPEDPDEIAAGELGGRVLISGAEAPVGGAKVRIRSPEMDVTVVTGADGRWRIVDLPPGNYRVTVESPGFVMVDVGEQVASGKATELTYRLTAEPDGLEVLVEAELPPREVTRRVITRREMNRIPGTSGDALRSIQSLPGVARAPLGEGLLIVRGSSPDDTAIFIDGATVPLLYHFGGLSSVVPTEMLDSIDFYPGNFSARYGRVMGGIVDVKLREPNIACNGPYGRPSEETGCFHGLTELTMIDGRVMLQGPIVDGWSFALAGRRSWLDAWLGPALRAAGLGVTRAPVYYDYQAIAEARPSDKTRLSFRWLGSDDRLEILVRDVEAGDDFVGGNIALHTGHHGGQVLLQHELSPDVDLEASVAVGRTEFDFRLGNVFFEVLAQPITVRSELGYQVLPWLRFNAGHDFLIIPFELDTRIPEEPLPGEPAQDPFTTAPLISRKTTDTLYRPAWFAEAEVRPIDRWLITPGVRVDAARDSGQTDLSPRVTSRFDIIRSDEENPDRRRTTLKGGVGAFYQPPDFGETDEVLGTPRLGTNRAIHYSMGVEQELTEQIEVSVEGFYKDLDDLVSRTPDDSGRFAYDNAGNGDVIGLEVLAKYKADERFFGWVAYSLSRSRRRDRPEDPLRLFEFDQTHNLTALGSYRLGRGWEIGARFRLISGRLTTPIQDGLAAIFAADAGTYVPIEGDPFSERLPLFHQLDVRVDKTWQFRDWKLNLFLDILNIYNHQAVEAASYNFNYTRRGVETGLPIIPSLGIRGEF